jgi:hypothetical protein
MHQRQDPVAARLERVVQVLAHRRSRAHRGERLGPHVLRVRAGEPHATDAVDPTDVAEQVGEQRPQPGAVVAGLAGGELEVAPIRVDVLAEQGDLGDTVARELAHLGQHVVVRAAHLGPTHGGHDAERAVVVAADLDGDPGVVARLTPRRERRREHRVVVDHGLLEDLDERAGAALRLVQELGGAVHVVGAHHHVGPRRLRRHDVAVLLGQAARHDDLTTRLRVLPGRRWPRLPYSLLSAFSRMQQVLSTTTSASSSESARTMPSASSRPAMRSESCSFIWHP